MTKDKQQATSGGRAAATGAACASFSPPITRHPAAFTLIEMLAVITILGILAGLAVPALKNIGKADANLGASQQLLQDLGHARQLAINNHTTIYMIFVPTNFWGGLAGANLNSPVTTNLVDKQLSGYTFISYGAVGDQPGNHQWQYLAPWENLPSGTFIAAQKFSEPPSQFYYAPNPPDPVSGAQYDIYGFNTGAVPFPTVNAPQVSMPCIAFNYLGQLTTQQLTPQCSQTDEYIPLAHGSVSFGVDPSTKAPQLSTVQPSDITEIPPGNSTDISYTVIHIDALTGRANMETFKLQ